eukprot:scaffold32207_cov48-Phaeocystis_antarctica.AAC.2
MRRRRRHLGWRGRTSVQWKVPNKRETAEGARRILSWLNSKLCSAFLQLLLVVASRRRGYKFTTPPPDVKAPRGRCRRLGGEWWRQRGCGLTPIEGLTCQGKREAEQGSREVGCVAGSRGRNASLRLGGDGPRRRRSGLQGTRGLGSVACAAVA